MHSMQFLFLFLLLFFYFFIPLIVFGCSKPTKVFSELQTISSWSSKCSITDHNICFQQEETSDKKEKSLRASTKLKAELIHIQTKREKFKLWCYLMLDGMI
jgi:hypothetical protein